MTKRSEGDWDSLVAAATGFSSDTRELRAGDIYVALRGRFQDGHQYLPNALARGASALVVDASCSFKTAQVPVVQVPDTALAHRQLAALFRRKSRAPLIAVAGSNGKTTTTQCVAHLCRDSFITITTQGSQNGLLGIPKTLEQLRPETELMVLEVGIDGPGFMMQHWDLLRPDICILTSIGAEHMERFTGLEQVFAEESSILIATLKDGGRGFVPDQDPWLKQLESSPRLERVSAASLRFEHPYPHQRMNVALAAAAARSLGIPDRALDERLQRFAIPDGRGQFVRYRPDTWIVRDHYNANPDSMQRSIEATQAWARSHALPWHGILGDMLDLGAIGADAHRQLLSQLQLGNQDSLTLFGPLFAKALASIGPEPRVRQLESLDRIPEDLFEKPGVYLVKASRGMKLERLLPAKEGA